MMVAGSAFTFPLPPQYSDAEAAPLLCAGAIGYRSLHLGALRNGMMLGLTGFGASGHLVLKLARHLYPDSPVIVFARNEGERTFARELGAVWSGDTTDEPPQRPDVIIDTTPAWRPVVEALKVLQRGGRLVINAIRKEETDKGLLQRLDYPSHLWMEKEIKTVANVTRNDVLSVLSIASEIELKPEVEEFPLAEANRALMELKRGKIRGAKVLRMNV
jgi:propanol-preferring alcohol dehydrogenase